MPEKENVFSSKIKYKGIFSLSDYYNFCYDWLRDETQMDMITEEKYSEKIKETGKDIEFVWKGQKKLTDYFRFDIEITARINWLTEVEINQGGAKVKSNKGNMEMKTVGVLVRDYDGKFETTAFRKFLRSIYEKWVIPARIEEFQGKVFDYCDEFMSQAKAYLDLEGRK
ncbi:MAG: hypothetical protein ABIH49_01305 [archaeon]